MKKIKKGIMAFLLAAVFLLQSFLVTPSARAVSASFENSGSTAETSSGYIYPNPSAGICCSLKPRLFKYGYGTIYCFDPDGFSDLTIDISDIEVQSSCLLPFLNNIKITDVYEPRTVDGVTYSWDFRFKGTALGYFWLSLKVGAVCDSFGYYNRPTVPFRAKVVLF